MQQYRELVERILAHGMASPDRTGTGTLSVFGHQMRFDLADHFPLVTMKRTAWRAAFIEMLWMLRGESSIDWLERHRVKIWNEWADENGDLGPIYGHQWRAWGGAMEMDFATEMDLGTDQLATLEQGLRDRPYSRRHILSAWNVDDLPDEFLSPQENVANGKMALAPCHMVVQFHVSPSGRLSAQVYQRSADVFLGVPFNIAGYALLVHLLAHRLGYTPGELIWTGGDCHLYRNHLEQARAMLDMRQPLPGTAKLVMHHAPGSPLSLIEPGDLEVVGYHSHEAIRAPVSV